MDRKKRFWRPFLILNIFLKGDFGEKLSVRFYQETPLREKYLVVVYKEEEKEGFILTAYFTRKPAQWRKVLWKQ